MRKVPLSFANPKAQNRFARPSAAACHTHESPSPLGLWHLASLDAPTVAVVWALAFAWAAKVSLPVWTPVLLALATWAVYVGDRLLDARRAFRTGQLQCLPERHRFHWRHRRILIPLAVAATSAAAWIVFFLMPAGIRERNSVLAAAALVYFTRVHSGRIFPRFRSALPSRLFAPIPSSLLSKELLVGGLFTAGCVLPAWSRNVIQTGSAPWPLFATARLSAGSRATVSLSTRTSTSRPACSLLPACSWPPSCSPCTPALPLSRPQARPVPCFWRCSTTFATGSHHWRSARPPISRCLLQPLSPRLSPS